MDQPNKEQLPVLHKQKKGFFTKRLSGDDAPASNINNPLKTLKYQERLIVIVNGQPFYKSTGKNSGLADTWLPLIMICGTLPYPGIYAGFEIPSPFIRYFLDDILSDSEKTGCFIKYSVEYVSKETFDLDIKAIDSALSSVSRKTNADGSPIYRDDSAGRFVRREHLIISARLGGGFWNDTDKKNEFFKAAKLDPDEIQSANTPLFVSALPETEIFDPNAVNIWLMKNGACDIYDILLLNEEKLSAFTCTLLSSLPTICDFLHSKAYPSWMDRYAPSDPQIILLFKQFYTPINDLVEALIGLSKSCIKVGQHTISDDQNVIIDLAQETASWLQTIMPDRTTFTPTKENIREISEYCSDKIKFLENYTLTAPTHTHPVRLL